MPGMVLRQSRVLGSWMRAWARTVFSRPPTSRVSRNSLRPGQIVLVKGVLDVGQELATLTDEVSPATKKIPGRPHGSRIGVGLGEESSPEQASGLERIDAVVLGFGPVDGLHVEGMAENEGDLVLGAEVSEPVPVEDAF